METKLNYDEMTVAEIVTKNIRTADIFKKNGIDFCCGGNILVKDVCIKKNVDFEKIKSEIESLSSKKAEHNFNSWDLDFLADYIINTHHKYVTEANALIIQYSDKVAKVHGHHYTQVVEINKLFHAIATELENHMIKEENVLFPFIKQLALSKKDGSTYNQPPFGSIQNPINMMESEHDSAGDTIKKIAELSNDFNPPAEACNTFKALYAKLEEYQNDLFNHIHLENNILFPKAIALEKELMN